MSEMTTDRRAEIAELRRIADGQEQAAERKRQAYLDKAAKNRAKADALEMALAEDEENKPVVGGWVIWNGAYHPVVSVSTDGRKFLVACAVAPQLLSSYRWTTEDHAGDFRRTLPPDGKACPSCQSALEKQKQAEAPDPTWLIPVTVTAPVPAESPYPFGMTREQWVEEVAARVLTAYVSNPDSDSRLGHVDYAWCHNHAERFVAESERLRAERTEGE